MKHLITKAIFSGLLAISALTVSGLSTAQAQPHAGMMPPPPPMQRTISVTGEAQEDFEPDQLNISVTLVSRDNNLADAKKENDKQLARLLNVTRDYDIPKENIVTSSIRTNPEYNYSKENKRNLVGYTISRSIEIKADDTSVQERLLAGFVDAEINQVNGVNFSLSKPEDKRSALRIQAFNDAKSKAEALAGAAGMKLGKAVNISTSGSMGHPQPYPMMAMSERGMADSQSVAPTVSGSVSLQENVSVTFSLVSDDE